MGFQGLGVHELWHVVAFSWYGIACLAPRNANAQSPVDVYMVSQTAAMMDVEEGQG